MQSLNDVDTQISKRRVRPRRLRDHPAEADEVLQRVRQKDVQALEAEVKQLKRSVQSLTRKLAAERDRRKESSDRAHDFDPQTKLHSKTKFWRTLRHLVERQEKGELDRIYVWVIDANRLKWINDNLGHLEGDRYIRWIADCLREEWGVHIKSSASHVAAPSYNRRLDDWGSMARGGKKSDEYYVTLVDVNKDPQLMTEELAEAVSARRFGSKKDTGVSVSIGYTVSTKEKPIKPRTLVARADRAMYKQKQKSREQAAS